MSFHQKHPFDALYTLAQILSLQSLFYLFLPLLVLGPASLLSSLSLFSLPALLDPSQLDAGTSLGWALAFCMLISSLLLVPPLILGLVGRSRLCLDFSCTLWGLHALLGCWSYGHLPSSPFYYLILSLCMTGSVQVSQHLCQWEELRPINLSGGGGTHTAVNGNARVKDKSLGGGGRRGGEEMNIPLIPNSSTTSTTEMANISAGGGGGGASRVGGGGGGGMSKDSKRRGGGGTNADEIEMERFLPK